MKSKILIVAILLISVFTFAQNKKGNNIQKATYIDVFDVSPENEKEVSELLIEINNQFLKKHKGYISAKIYQSEDKTKMYNISEWTSDQSIPELLKNKEAITMIMKASSLSKSFIPLRVQTIYEDKIK